MEILVSNRKHTGGKCDKIHSETPPKERKHFSLDDFIFERVASCKVRWQIISGLHLKKKGGIVVSCFGNVGREIHVPTKD